MAHLIELPGSEPVNEGERRVVAALVTELPDSYWVIPSVEIAEPGGQVFEYDVVVVAPYAVYVVETKDWGGRISGDRREWLVNGSSRRAPLSLAERKAKVLKSKLVDQAQVLARVWVEAAVVFARTPEVLALTPDIEARVLTSPEALVRFVLDPAAVRRPPSDIVDLGQAIVRAISGTTRTRTQRLTFGQYEVTEVLEQGEEESLYLARHRQLTIAPAVRLRVVSLSPYRLTPQLLADREAVVFRELHALLLMGSHPNVIAARDVFKDEERQVVVAVLDGTEGRSLRHRLLEDTPLTVQQRLDVLIDTCRALAHAHAHKLVHRTISPESILLGDDGIARVGRFGLAKILTANTNTVWTPDNADDVDPRYLAPELVQPTLGQVGPATDLYSLGCVAYELFAGYPPYETPLQALAGTAARLSDVPTELADLVADLLVPQPTRRPEDAKGVLNALMAQRIAGTGRPATAPKDHYMPGDAIDGKFEVRATLGGGGFSEVYRVYWAMDDSEYALKVFNMTVPYDKVQREIRLLRQIDHPHVVRAIWADQTKAGQWYLVTEFVEGETLEAYARGYKRLSIGEAVRVSCEVLGALEAIHPDTHRILELREAQHSDDFTEEQYYELGDLEDRGIVHRDIKPQNIMLTPDAGAVLIDFNISSKVGQSIDTLSGTPRYLSPDLVSGVDQWEVSPDLFAVGVLLYELITYHHPYPDAQPRTDIRPADPREYRPELSVEMAELLLRACAPYRDERFTTALEMRLALEAVDSYVIPAVIPPTGELSIKLLELLAEAPPNVNPMVDQFLALSSQARRTNRGTRGIDDLTEATYVETKLDSDLHRSVLDGKHRLVIVTGNAGDGKTAFIQQVERSALRLHAQVLRQDTNGMHLRYENRDIFTLYDGSQDEEDRTSDEVLRDFLGPFAIDVGGAGAVRLAAINEGRLRDFLLSHREPFRFLANGVISTLDDPGQRPFGDDIVVVNLNVRSVTAGGTDSIFSQQLQRIVTGPFWAPCQTCDYRARCPIKHNVDTFRDTTSGPAATERLRTLVDLIRLRRRRHLTMRDVRSLISHILFRDRTCLEIAEELTDDNPLTVVDLAYFQAVGGHGVPENSLLERGAALLAEVDLGLVANPDDDRTIARGGGPRLMAFPERSADNYMAERIDEARQKAGSGYDSDVPAARRAHEAARRRFFFERADDGWWSMLPYGGLRDFQDRLLSSDDGTNHAELLGNVIAAISMSEGIPDQRHAANALWLATRDDSPIDYRCYRRFPLTEFSLHPVRIRSPYVESEPDRMELIHEPGGARLTLDIDLLEVLDRLREGYVPSQDEGRGILINLALFKQQLLAVPSHELLILDGERVLRIGTGTQPGLITLSTVDE